MMESQDLNRKLIDYLYGEMNNSEKKEFEELLKKDSELRKEMEELQKMRSDLSLLEEKEVMEPFSIWGGTKSNWLKGRERRQSIMLNPITAIAASLVLLMFVGYATNFSVSINSSGFQLSFNKTERSENPANITEDDVKRILARELDQNNHKIQTDLDETRELFNSKLAVLENTIDDSRNKENQEITADDLNQFFVQMQEKNAQLLQDYISQSSAQQQKYFKTMLTQFNDYIQEQRAEDLTMIQSDLLELKYSQTRQKIATDEVLAGLITTVNQKRN